MNPKMIKLDNFLSANGMKINESKTEYVPLKPKGKKITETCEIYYRDNVFKAHLLQKMLGFHIRAYSPV